MKINKKIKRLVFILNYVCTCGFVFTGEYRHPGIPGKSIRFSAAGVTGSCELFKVGAGIPSQVLWKSSKSS